MLTCSVVAITANECKCVPGKPLTLERHLWLEWCSWLWNNWTPVPCSVQKKKIIQETLRSSAPFFLIFKCPLTARPAVESLFFFFLNCHITLSAQQQSLLFCSCMQRVVTMQQMELRVDHQETIPAKPRRRWEEEWYLEGCLARWQEGFYVPGLTCSCASPAWSKLRVGLYLLLKHIYYLLVVGFFFSQSFSSLLSPMVLC